MEYPNWLKKRAHISAQAPALIFQNKQETFAEIYEEVILLAGKLRALGVTRGMSIGLLGKNDRDTFLFIHAFMQIGAHTVFVNNRLTSTEIRDQMKDSGASGLIYAPSFKAKVIHTIEKINSYTDVFNQKAHAFFPPETFSSNQIATIMYTSGTTGRAKGVLQTYQNHFYSAVSSALHFGISPEEDSWLCVVPIFHISGLSILMRSVIYGISIYLEEHFEEKRLRKFLEDGTITHVSLVVTMLKRLLAINETNCHKNVKVILIGGSSIPQPCIEASLKRRYPIVQSFGMTETASQVVALKPEYAKRKMGSSGQALFSVELRVVNNKKVAAINEIGEIEIKSPNVTPGYLNRPKETRSTFHEGFFKTGDMGYLDEEGFLFVVDRRKDLIISGGENIYPIEIEQALLMHPDIQETAVVGVEDDAWGEVPVAYFTSSHSLAEKELIAYLELNLAKFKIPKKFIQTPYLPKTATGKISKYLLKNTLPKKKP